LNLKTDMAMKRTSSMTNNRKWRSRRRRRGLSLFHS
jgi:hypothetical protein